MNAPGSGRSWRRKRSPFRAAVAFLGASIVTLGVMFGPQTSFAADEDMSTSIYLEFDPETGDFKTVHDYDLSKQRAEDNDPANYSLSPSSTSEPAAGPSIPFIASAIALAAVLIGLAAARIRRSRNKAN